MESLPVALPELVAGLLHSDRGTAQPLALRPAVADGADTAMPFGVLLALMTGAQPGGETLPPSGNYLPKPGGAAEVLPGPAQPFALPLSAAPAAPVAAAPTAPVAAPPTDPTPTGAQTAVPPLARARGTENEQGAAVRVSPHAPLSAPAESVQTGLAGAHSPDAVPDAAQQLPEPEGTERVSYASAATHPRAEAPPRDPPTDTRSRESAFAIPSRATPAVAEPARHRGVRQTLEAVRAVADPALDDSAPTLETRHAASARAPTHAFASFAENVQRAQPSHTQRMTLGPPSSVSDAGTTQPAASSTQAAPAAPAANLLPTPQQPAPSEAFASVQAGTVDTNAPRWQEALASRIHLMVDHDVSEARLKLNPPELGMLDVKIAVHDDKTYVQLAASSAAARDELTQSLPRLRELMSLGGLNLGGATVSDGGYGRQPGAPEVSALRAFAGDGKMEAGPTLQTAPRRSSGIDLYA